MPRRIDKYRFLKFKRPSDLGNKIVDYIDDCKEKGNKITLSGAARWCGTTVELLRRYREKPAYRIYIDNLFMMYMEQHERNILDGRNVGGSIFVLKNMGWKDEQTVHGEVTGTFNVVVGAPRKDKDGKPIDGQKR